MKKIVFVILAAAVLLTACGSAKSEERVQTDESRASESSKTAEPVMQPAPTGEAAETAEPSEAETSAASETPSQVSDCAVDCQTDSFETASGGNAVAESGNYIIVYKSKRLLVLYDGSGNEIKQYKVGLAQNPVGAKEKAGDKKTPEGSYYVCVKNAASKFHKALGLSYPNSDDAARGLKAGLITETEKEAIDAAIAAGGRPDWNTALGGEIMIHGQKGNMGSQLDWTTGCIAVNNEDIDDLWNYTAVGTRVTIMP